MTEAEKAHTDLGLVAIAFLWSHIVSSSWLHTRSWLVCNSHNRPEPPDFPGSVTVYEV